MTSAWTEIIVTFIVGVLVPALLARFGLKVPVIVPGPKVPTPAPDTPAEPVSPTPSPSLLDDILRRLLDRIVSRKFGEAEAMPLIQATAPVADPELKKLEMIERLLTLADNKEVKG